MASRIKATSEASDQRLEQVQNQLKKHLDDQVTQLRQQTDANLATLRSENDEMRQRQEQMNNSMN